MQCNPIYGLIDFEPINSYELEKGVSSHYLKKSIVSITGKFTELMHLGFQQEHRNGSDIIFGKLK
jgi:hypothetical protein